MLAVTVRCWSDSFDDSRDARSAPVVTEAQPAGGGTTTTKTAPPPVSGIGFGTMQCDAPGSPDDATNINDEWVPPITAESLRRQVIGTWRTYAGDLDVLIGIPSGVPNKEHQYEALRSRAAARDITGYTVYVADLADIIASKEAADREKDREALPELRELRAAQVAKAAYPEGIEAALGEHDTPARPVDRPGSGRDYGRDPPGRTLT